MTNAKDAVKVVAAKRSFLHLRVPGRQNSGDRKMAGNTSPVDETTQVSAAPLQSLSEFGMEWVDAMTIQCDGIRLGLIDGLNARRSTAEEIVIFKDPEFILSYKQSLKGFDARNVVEVGVWHGGSALFFWNLLKPAKLCCLDLKDRIKHFESYIQRSGLSDRLRLHLGVDQSDRDAIRQIIASEFPQGDLDLVIDDASHLYDPSKATFETLFPRLRQGGRYYLEDWMTPPDIYPDLPEEMKRRPSLFQLVHDIVDFSITNPGAISAIEIRPKFVIFERGALPLDAENLRL